MSIWQLCVRGNPEWQLLIAQYGLLHGILHGTFTGRLAPTAPLLPHQLATQYGHHSGSLRRGVKLNCSIACSGSCRGSAQSQDERVGFNFFCQIYRLYVLTLRELVFRYRSSSVPVSVSPSVDKITAKVIDRSAWKLLAWLIFVLIRIYSLIFGPKIWLEQSYLCT